jgi:type II secretory pathway predicted ATPase ExeA
MRKRRKPIVLVVDDAHDLLHHTLTSLKRIIEMVADGDGKPSVLLAGHPKLRSPLAVDFRAGEAKAGEAARA